MPLDDRAVALVDAMTEWRHTLHARPETAFEEHWTSDFIAARLKEFGLHIHRGLAGTGVVGTLAHGDGPAIALRADMDALHVDEATGLPWASRRDGRMHACGHDGHSAMLLGAAKALADSPLATFRGTVYFVFQPAEENDGGGRVMVEEGLFDKFPCQGVYGLHNWPGMAVGAFALRAGPMMASFDVFEIEVHGRGAHAAMPHMAVDPIVAAAEIVGALQTVASRSVHPVDSVVLSVTQIHAGHTWNVIPGHAMLRGTTRAFRPEVRDTLEPAIRRIAEGVAAAHGARVEVTYDRRYPPTHNNPTETGIAAHVAAQVVGAGHVDHDPLPSMGAEDFAFMLEKVPGCYVWMGNGPSEGGRTLHSPRYDFNDEALPVGASYWIKLVETVLG